MKRKLSLLLAVVMILGSFSFAFADEPMTEADAGEFLKEKGVLVGINGELKLEDNLRREDAVVMVARLHGAEEEAEAFPTEGLTFKDVTDPYYQSIISWAVANELFEGHTPEKFGYHEDISAQQYATVLLRALGYGEEVADKAGYDKALELADELGLLEGLKVANTTPITRGQMALMTYNALGTKMKDSNETLADKLEIEMPAPEVLEVEEVKADNLKEIKVVFNKDVESELLDLDLYETDAGEIVDLFVEENNVLVLVMDGKMTNKKAYTLTVDGTEEVDGDYDFTAYDNTIPEVVDVVALGTKAIKVTMSEPIKEANISDFKLDGKTIYGTTEIVGRDIIVKPYRDLDVKEYELTVARLEDYNNFKSLETKRSFVVVEDKEKPVVVDVQATLENAVITFSEDIDQVSVSRYNVYHGNKVYPENAVKIAGNKVAVVFTASKALPVYETTLYVSGFADYSGNKMDAAEIKVKPVIDESRPEVLKAELQKDLKTIAIKFSKTVNKEDAKDISNYTVLDDKDNKLTIAEANADGRVVELVLGKSLAENKVYTLKVSGIRDNNKYPNVMFAYETKISVGDVSAPVYLNAIGESKLDDDAEYYVTEVHVLFNKTMDLGTLANPENYLVKFEGDAGTTKLLSDVNGSIDILKGDGEIVLLKAKTKEKVAAVGVLGVKDTTGKKLSNYGEMKTLATISFDALEATATAKDTVVVEFTGPVKEARTSNFKFVDNDATIKDVSVSGNKVTLSLDKGLSADASGKLIVDGVKPYIGKEIEDKTIAKIIDKIAPSITKVDVVEYKTGDEDVILKVVFDEDIELTAESKSVIGDFVVKKINGDKAITIKSIEHDKDDDDEEIANVLVIKIKTDSILEGANKLETAFEVSIVDNPRYIKDGSKNVPKAHSVRSEKKTIVYIPAVKTIKIQGGKTIEIPEENVTVTEGYTAVVKDQAGKVMPDVKVTWSVEKDGNPVEGMINEEGKLKLTSQTEVGKYTIKATVGDVTGDLTVEIKSTNP